MNISIKYPKHPALSPYIQYYIFSAQTGDQSFSYTTFPNTNLCLSFYKENHLAAQLSETVNQCTIQKGKAVQSRLWGFHKQPFNVLIEGNMDQVSIIFHPGGIRRFSRESYAQMLHHPDAGRTIFGTRNDKLIEQLFSVESVQKRVAILDNFLLAAMRQTNEQHELDRLLRELESQIESPQVFDLATKQHMDASTLYRKFKNHVGQSPKEYLKVVRFRKALNAIQRKNYSNFTDLTYNLGYYDQSHFIRDFTQFTKRAPGLIYKSTETVDDKLIWITAK